ncbi:MAG: hypothetical protein AAB874_05625 [Patescibacteria group bacterium]
MKNKSALYISVAVLLLVLIGGYLIIKNLSNKPAPVEEEEVIQVELPPADPGIEVDLKAKPDGKSVILTVAKIPSTTDSVEYELSYLTGEGLPKGALGKISLNGKTELTRDVLLGTCSTGGKCTYDLGVTAVKLVLKFNSPSGATQFSKEYPLN